jgi:hypothetical protein
LTVHVVTAYIEYDSYFALVMVTTDRVEAEKRVDNHNKAADPSDILYRLDSIDLQGLK